METYKAAFIDLVRREIDRQGPARAQAFYAALSPEDREKFGALLPMAWISPEQGGRIVAAAAQAFFGSAPEPLFEMGRQQAIHDMTGMYRVLLKVASVPMVIRRAAQMFQAYHKQGSATVEHASGTTSGTFIIHDYPGLTSPIRATVGGFIAGLLELTGAKAIQVRAIENDPNAWRWELSWQ